MGKYAEHTSVSVVNSKAEIEKIITRYGADQFQSGWDTQAGKAIVQFRWKGRHARFLLSLPDPKSTEFTKTSRRRSLRSPKAAHEAWEQAQRQRWRALALVIKAKFEAIESGITTFDQEFLAHIVLPDNRTAGEYLIPQIEIAYQTKEMPKMLPMLEDHSGEIE